MGGFFCVTKLLGIALILTCLLCNICCKLIISIPLSLNGHFKNSLSSRTTLLTVPFMHLVLILNLAKSLIASNMCLGMMFWISILSAMLTSVGNRVERRLSIYDLS